MIKKDPNSIVYKIVRKVQNVVVKTLRPLSNYYIAPLPKRVEDTKNVEPLSTVYGYDRGTPIDRYYIEQFMEKNADVVKGACLEITDTAYIQKYGKEKVSRADALDINTNNKVANLYGDLRDLKDIADETYDCLIITQTFVMIDDYPAAIKECHRILKKGGYILVTMPCLGPVWNIDHHHWRWTRASGEYIFNKYFVHDELEVKTYGNALAGQCFWVGMALEEMDKKELDYNDQYFPVIVSIKARKA